jgi:hypothetical protein
MHGEEPVAEASVSTQKKWRRKAGVGLIVEEGCDGARGASKRDAERCSRGAAVGDYKWAGPLSTVCVSFFK